MTAPPSSPVPIDRDPHVYAPISAILLLSAGRLAALPHVSGPGAAELAARLTSPARIRF
jgi:hypothetical protein